MEEEEEEKETLWIDGDQVSILPEILGGGLFSVVKLAKWRDRFYALKTISLPLSDDKFPEKISYRFKQLISEMEVCTDKRVKESPFLVHCKGIVKPETTIAKQCQHYTVSILFELVSGGTLSLHLSHRMKHKNNIHPFSLSEIRVYTAQLVLAVDHLHSLGYIHRDIKPSNIIFDNLTGMIKLADFGSVLLNTPTKQEHTPSFDAHMEHIITFSNSQSKHSKHMRVGSPPYSSPESLCGPQSTSFASDWYSLGILVFQLYTGHAPTYNKVALYLNEKTQMIGKEENDWIDLVRALVERDPLKRIGVEEIKGHCFFRGVDWCKLAMKECDEVPPFDRNVQQLALYDDCDDEKELTREEQKLFSSF